MNLSKKMLLMITAVVLTLAAVSLISTYCIVLRGTRDIEQNLVKSGMNRLKASLSSEMKSLENTVLDWSSWDDTYSFVQNKNEAYISQNLDQVSAKNLNVNLIGVLDTSLNPIVVKEYDGADFSAKDVTEESLSKLLNSYKNSRPEGTVEGLIVFNSEPMLISFQNILNNSGEGPMKGVLFMGRYVDDTFLHRYTDIVQGDISLSPTSEVENSTTEYRNAVKYLNSDSSGTYLVRNKTNTSGFAYLTDISSSKALVAKVSITRDIYESSLKNLLVLMAIMSAALLVTGFAVYRFVRVQMIDRITSLSELIKVDSHDNSFLSRITVEGNDEISKLEASFNEIAKNISKKN